MLRWLLLMTCVVASAHSSSCGFDYMETYYPNEVPSDCFYLQACMLRTYLHGLSHSEINRTVLNNGYAQNVTSDSAQYVGTEAAVTFKANEIVIQFLHRLFSDKSELLKNFAPEWSKELPKGPYKFRVIKTMRLQIADNPSSHFVVVKVCPDEKD
ncbi:hypothetical protein M3Y97_00690800 [Aphelenchoides bicaudatus]|nr:hypothetical protein M3Y97_00690800 [Aphelenchoides bicaudatus]